MKISIDIPDEDKCLACDHYHHTESAGDGYRMDRWRCFIFNKTIINDYPCDDCISIRKEKKGGS